MLNSRFTVEFDGWECDRILNLFNKPHHDYQYRLIG